MNNQEYLRIAIELAKESVLKWGFPAGAILVKNNNIISKWISIWNLLNDPTSHSETSAIKKACEILKTTNLENSILYTSMEPCNMCFSTANWAWISKIVFWCRKTSEMIVSWYYEWELWIEELNAKNSRKIEIQYISDFKEEILELIKKWEIKNNKH